MSLLRDKEAICFDLDACKEGLVITRPILAIFFHPRSEVTAVGGAEKRFIEVLRVWSKRVPITVLEPQPSLIEKYGFNLQHFQLSIPLAFRKDEWLSIYLEWVFWVLKACIHSVFLIPKRRYYGVVLASNNTLPSLLAAYFFHIVLSKPICVVVHHIDTLSPTKTNINSVYQMYRKIGYNRKITYLKVFAFKIMLFLLRRADACIAVSSSTATNLIKQGVPKSRIFISNNGVDFQYINDFKAEQRKRWDGVFVGRIAKEKGIYDLVSLWQKITAINRKAQLIIIGSGPDLEQLKKVIRNIHLRGSILVKGYLSDKEMYTTMRACRVFVFPSKLEGWGLAVAEALACGLPVVCYDIPALREVFGECESVFFVPVGNVDRLAEAFWRVLGQDRNGLEEISMHYAKRFGWKKVAMDDLQVIKQVIDGNAN